MLQPNSTSPLDAVNDEDYRTDGERRAFAGARDTAARREAANQLPLVHFPLVHCGQPSSVHLTSAQSELLRDINVWLAMTRRRPR